MKTQNPTIYLDYNATAPLRAEAREAMMHAMEWTGNASSIHSYGRKVRKEIEKAREDIAQIIGTDPINIVFTSGATESNNAVLHGAPVERILFSAIEHPSVIETCAKLPHAHAISVLQNGVVDLQALEKMLAGSDVKTLVSVMAVNNETGVIQPIKEVVTLAKKYNALVHCDAVQALGRIPFNMMELGIDYLSLSAHKIGGPAGIGVLVYDHHTPLDKFISGGGQERRRRAGTENMLGIIGFAAAAKAAQSELEYFGRLAEIRDMLENSMLESVPSAEFIGKNAPRVANTIQVIVPGATAEKQLMALDLAGIAVSSGSACSSGSVKPSHVLLAMGIPENKAKCAIRLSMGLETGPAEIEHFFLTWVANSQRFQDSVTS